jgi:hypothetical protein
VAGRTEAGDITVALSATVDFGCPTTFVPRPGSNTHRLPSGSATRYGRVAWSNSGRITAIPISRSARRSTGSGSGRPPTRSIPGKATSTPGRSGVPLFSRGNRFPCTRCEPQLGTVEFCNGWRADFQGRCENQEFRSPIFTLKIGERRSLALNSDFDGRRSHRSFPM